MTAEPQKVLIIKLSALGDVCLSLPHIEVIINHHRDEDVWIMTDPCYIDFFRHHPRLQVIALDRSKNIAKSSTLRNILWIRKMRFDVIYDLQGNRTSRLLSRLCKVPLRIGTQPYPFFNVHPREPYTAETQQNIFDRLNETLVAAGLPCAEPRADLFASDEEIEELKAWKSANRLHEKEYVLLHAGCSPEWPSKQWPAAFYASLAKMIEDAGLRCVWLGAEEDRMINEKLAESAGLNASAVFSFTQLFLLSKDARFAVTNDSGPMHVLALSGLPVYSFFGPTNWVRSHAVGQRDRVLIKTVLCSPCFLKKCPSEKKHICLAGIEPEEVFNRIDEELDIRNNQRRRLNNHLSF